LVATPASSAIDTAVRTAVLIVLQHQRQDLDHFPVTARRAQKLLLKPPEVLWQLQERRAIAQRSRLALDHCEIVAPVIDRAPRAIVRSLDDAPVFAHDLALGDDEEAIRIDPQAHRTIGERRRHTVAIAFQMYEAGGRDPLAIFHEAIERPARRHQAARFISPGISNRTGLSAMRDALPQRTASLLKPEVQGVQTFRMRYRLP
jgi:hypothetical protein